MSEVQKHGFSFEQWIRSTFFDSYEGESRGQAVPCIFAHLDSGLSGVSRFAPSMVRPDPVG